jgi:hypothetical protein
MSVIGLAADVGIRLIAVRRFGVRIAGRVVAEPGAARGG